LKQFTKRVVERAMQGEMAEHLGYEKHDPEGNNSGNSRNGVTSQTLKGDFGEVEVETPRDRNGEFEPRMVKKNQTRWAGFDDKILSMYSRGVSVRDIQGHLEEMYQVRGQPERDQRRDRRRDGAGSRLAEPAAGGFLRHRISGRTVRKNAA
jgi:putative transposase